ncbi:MAG: GntR family transcriptional regulator [Proteobacteria bacterium]|nr:GntR family transcriptional regulator [Pseudomonadota bacterium]
MAGRPPPTKRELAVEALRDAILRGKYEPGQRLRQNQVARELGLSATPVREALRELRAQGIVEHQSRRSVRVAELDLDNLRELYAVRSLLESRAARLSVPCLTEADLARLVRLQATMEAAFKAARMKAILAADKEFHETLYRSAGNRHLLGLVRQLWESFPRHLLWLVPGRTESSLAEHRRILAAARRRDGAAAARAVGRHLASGLKALSRHLSGLGPDRAPAPRTARRREAA